MSQKKYGFTSLYSFDSRNKIKVWNGWWEEDKDENVFIVKTEAGKLGGKLASKNTLVPKGTQGRSKEEQAALILSSKINDKFGEGYKSAKMYLDKLRKDKSILIDHNFTSDEEILEYARSFKKYTCPSNQDWIYLPMLAYPYKEEKHGNEYPYIAQPKLDGVRCISILRDDEIKMMSRGGNYYNIPHLKAQVEKLITLIQAEYTKSYIIDGELYNHELGFERISGIVRTGLNSDSVQTSLIDDSTFIEYHIYDIMSVVHSQARRIEILEHIREIIDKHNLNSIKIVESSIVNNYAEAIQLHDKYVDDNYEGLILRNKKSSYAAGQRSHSLLKVKKFFEKEFSIVGCKVDPKQTIEDSFVFTLRNDDGSLFSCRPRGTRARKLKYYQDIDNLVNKKAIVRYLDITNTGLPGKAHVKEIRNYE